MRGYFPVDVRDEKCTELVADYRCLFKSPGNISAADLTDCLEQSLRRALHPDAVVFVCIPKEVQQMLAIFQGDDGVKQALERASSKVCVAVCEIDQKGHIGNPIYIRNEPKSLPLIEAGEQEEIFKTGVSQLFDSPSVLSPAPDGFAFVKPSRRRSKYFLRAEAALCESEHVHFLAFALLAKIAKREEETNGHISVIFIDTMAIASLAYAVRELYHELYDKPKPRVESFHSYRGMKDIRNPLPGTSLCIISASYSMSMQRDWWEQTRCSHSEVFTLVTFKGAKDSEHAIYVFDKTDPLAGNADFRGLRDIRIDGESFSQEEVPLKSVLLTVNAHKSDSWFDLGPEYSKLGLFSIMKAGQPRDEVRPIFINGERLFKHDKFQEFLSKEMMQKVPLSVQAIVHQDDSVSKKMAGECLKLIKIIRSEGEIRIVSASELDSVHLAKEDALLVVAAVIGRGTKLRSISRDLRDLHLGARHYLVGFQLGESINDCEKLKNDLRFSATKSSITISVFEARAIGRTIGDAYENEEKILSSWAHLPKLTRIKERLFEMHERCGLRNGAFLPSSMRDDELLKLRKDFAYWEIGYSLEFDHSAAVLLTVASILQYAREHKAFQDDGHRLASDSFQQVVLSPENFARYNDGVIQAALLRAAHPSELDYSSSEENSRRMADMLSGIFKLNERQQGEAALEFAFALKSERLKLADKDMTRLQGEVRELCGEEKYVDLMKDLLGVGRTDAWNQGASI